MEAELDREAQAIENEFQVKREEELRPLKEKLREAESENKEVLEQKRRADEELESLQLEAK